MTRRIAVTMLVALAAGVALGSFTATRHRQACLCRRNGRWLADAPQRVLDQEARFNTDAAALNQTLTDEQATLAALLSKAETPDEAIIRQAQLVSDAHQKLLRCAGEHVISLRRSLSSEQCRRLMQFSADVVCGCQPGNCAMGGCPQNARGGYRWRRGQGPQARRMQGGAQRCGFVCKLQLSDEQVAAVTTQDPDYDTDIEDLRTRMTRAREAFAAGLQDDTATTETLTDRLDRVIEVHRLLDTRVAEHVVALRTELLPAQQTLLMGLCTAR